MNDRHLTIKALEMALKRRCPEIGLLHHSDQGGTGGFNRSSQHLDREGLQWAYRDAAVGSGGTRRRCVRQVGRTVARGSTGAVLGGDRPRAVQRGRGAGGGVPSRLARGGSAKWRHAATQLGPASGRYLSFAEREEIAILQRSDVGVREIARRLGRSPSTISRELRRNAATRGGRLEYRATTAQWHAERRAGARRSRSWPRNERAAAVRAGAARRRDHGDRTAHGAGAGGALDRSPSRAPARPALGDVVEPGADRQPAADRLPR